MDWNIKIEMVKHLNANNDDMALDIIIGNINDIDKQCWDMFFTAILLTKENINKNIEKHKLILGFTKNLKTDNFRCAMRMALYEELVTDK